ncbi:hypothetical protein BS50DRAFT_568271 [Corynespora cassiicola Philippines]|uniref:Uncharacterized protein n=1 Tax=Corynespora cassiicola Philippines TaxID=1448308 RepID=A0A2T2P517_CORCC|nr:hypothetical protein BS50DRAFT_568271 [Corynespora cassiicola Philippines]
MDFRTSQRLGNTTYIITLEELPQEKLNGFVSPSQEAVYIHFISAITSSHRVGVQISITPFCLREFPGQVFYFAEGIYVRCCAHIKREDILAPINEAAQVIYTRAVSWHTWNLRAPDIWYPDPLSFPILFLLLHRSRSP